MFSHRLEAKLTSETLSIKKTAIIYKTLTANVFCALTYAAFLPDAFRFFLKTEIHALGNLDIVLEYSVKLIGVILSALRAQDEKMDNCFDLPLHCHRQFADKSISCCLKIFYLH